MVNRIDRKRAATSKHGGFKYHYRSDESVKRHAERRIGTFDSIFKSGIDKFTARSGDNLIRILPPTWEDKEHFGYHIFVHKFVGPDNGTYLCPRQMLNKKCPICEMEKDANDAKEIDDAKALRAKEDYIYWILDRNGDSETTPIIWQQSAMSDRDIVALTRPKGKKAAGTLYIDHPDEGYDLSFKRTQLSKDIKTTRYTAFAFDREATPIADDQKTVDEILDFITANPLPDILKFYTYDQLDKIMSGGAEEKDEELDDEEDEDKKPRKRGGAEEEGEDEEIAASRKAKRRHDEDEQDDTDDEDDTDADEDDSPKTRRSIKARQPVGEDDNKSTSRKKAQKSEDEDEDEDEDEENDEDNRPRKVTREKSKKRLSRNDDDDDDDEAAENRPRRSSRDDDDE